MKATDLKRYEDDIHRLDVAMRELKVKYDQFFAGALDRPPIELRSELDGIVRRITRQPPNQYAMRFRINSLVGRYNSFVELWGRTLRKHEEGDHRSQSVAEKMGIRRRLLTRCVIDDPERSQAEILRLHSRFVAARARVGKGAISLEKFSRGILSQSQRLRAQHECSQIEVRLVESGDKIEVRARPSRQADGSRS